MAMRGAAPTAICPRCGTHAPPTDEPLVHCAECKLAFDPRSEPIVRLQRRESRELQPAPPGIVIEREPGEVTISWSFERMKGIAALLLAVICIAMFIGNWHTPDESWRDMGMLGIAIAFLSYVGAVFLIGTTRLRIDERQIQVRREPLRFGRGLWIGRHEIQSIDLVGPDAAENRIPERDVKVVAVTPRGALALFVIDSRVRGARETASCIAEVIREAIEDMPAT